MFESKCIFQDNEFLKFVPVVMPLVKLTLQNICVYGMNIQNIPDVALLMSNYLYTHYTRKHWK